MTADVDNPRATPTASARDACMAAYQLAITTRRANCVLCDDAGWRLDAAGVPTREHCTHTRRSTDE